MTAINSHDRRTVFGQNLDSIHLICQSQIHDLTENTVKNNIRYWPTKDEDVWQDQLCLELMKCQDEVLEIPGFEGTEIKDMFRYTCIS